MASLVRPAVSGCAGRLGSPRGPSSAAWIDSLDLSSASGRQLFRNSWPAPSLRRQLQPLVTLRPGAVTATAGCQGLRDLMSQIGGGMGGGSEKPGGAHRAAVDANVPWCAATTTARPASTPSQRATQDRYQLELQLIEQIDQALADVHATAQGSVRSMRHNGHLG